MSEVTVGIDIGTSSVKAVAADADGNVLARSRIPHEFRVPSPLRFEHDAAVAWHTGPQRALADLGEIKPRAVSVAAMVPSLTAVDDDGVPMTPGLLYGDERGHSKRVTAIAEAGELMQFLRWQAEQKPDARGYWMAQAVANHTLSGRAIVSTTVAATANPLFDWQSWDAQLLAECGARADQMPEIGVSGQPLADVRGREGCVLEGGTIDAMAEQIVAGCGEVGDVLVICGTTLIVWAVIDEPAKVANHYTIPYTTPGKFVVGGPSNAGGLFLNWVDRMLGSDGDGVADPGRVPVWVPYPRGERVPLQDSGRRAQLVDLDLTHDAASVRRAAFEASAFVARRMIDASPVARSTHRRHRRRNARRHVDHRARRLHRVARARVRSARRRCARRRVSRAARRGPRDLDGRRRPLGADGARRRPRPEVGDSSRGPLPRFCEVAR